MKTLSAIAALLLSAALFTGCGKKSTEPDDNNVLQGTAVSLDTSSVLTASVTVPGPSGSSLLIDPGTTILMQNSSGDFEPVPSGTAVELRLTTGDAANASLPPGNRVVAAFVIGATANQSAAELLFQCHPDSARPAVFVSGAHWTAVLTDTSVRAGSRISLYRVSDQGACTFIESRTLGVPSMNLAKSLDGGGQNASASPNGTGQFVVGAGTGTSSSSSLPQSGVYWTTFSSIPSNPYMIGGETYGDSLYVGYVEIGEMSTGDILAAMQFESGNNCATYTNPNDHAQYWVERTQDASGVTTALTVAATVANVVYLNLQLCNIANGSPELSANGLRPDGGVVHTPEGGALADPYQYSSLKFGGFKALAFSVKNVQQGLEIRGKVAEAGYEWSDYRYAKPISSFIVVKTQDARKLIEENVLQKERWYPVAAGTRGNAGLYAYRDSIVIDITSHENDQTVSTSQVTISGTIDNPAKEWDPVTDMLVTYSNLTNLETKEAHATIGGEGTSFTIDLDLEPGMTTFSFAPMGQDEEGAAVYFNKYILKAKGETIDGLLLTYDASWTGEFELTVEFTSETKNPWTDEVDSRIEETRTMSTFLKFHFDASKLGYIEESHENAVTCAGFDNCWLFYGTNEGFSVSQSVNTKQYGRDCEGDLPVVLTSQSSGEAMLTKCSVTVAAALTPWQSGDNSQARRYHLRVRCSPDGWAMSTDPNWPQAQGSYLDCSDEEWKETQSKIGFNVDLNKDDVPPVLEFPNAADLEAFTAAPTSSRTWTFARTVNAESEDGLSKSVTKYNATLTVH
jgi:hypothetical protein